MAGLGWKLLVKSFLECSFLSFHRQKKFFFEIFLLPCLENVAHLFEHGSSLVTLLSDEGPDAFRGNTLLSIWQASVVKTHLSQMALQDWDRDVGIVDLSEELEQIFYLFETLLEPLQKNRLD